jgi:hypothetical protein
MSSEYGQAIHGQQSYLKDSLWKMLPGACSYLCTAKKKRLDIVEMKGEHRSATD